jgi:hypothetical protein
LKRLGGWVKAQAQQELSADTLFAVQLCLEEAVANIIMHGGGAKDDHLRIASSWSAMQKRWSPALRIPAANSIRLNSRPYRWRSRSRRRKSALSASTWCAALRVVCITNGKRAEIG